MCDNDKSDRTLKDSIEKSTPTLQLIRVAVLGRTQSLVLALKSKGIPEEKFYNS
jgi:hypothetical protein